MVKRRPDPGGSHGRTPWEAKVSLEDQPRQRRRWALRHRSSRYVPLPRCGSEPVSGSARQARLAPSFLFRVIKEDEAFLCSGSLSTPTAGVPTSLPASLRTDASTPLFKHTHNLGGFVNTGLPIFPPVFYRRCSILPKISLLR